MAFCLGGVVKACSLLNFGGANDRQRELFANRRRGETLGEIMTKQDKLDILMLLSALESWGFSTKSMFPDYMHEELRNAVELLSKEVLNGEQ